MSSTSFQQPSSTSASVPQNQLTLDHVTRDISFLHDLELQYDPKLFANSPTSFQCTLSLVKDGTYYSCYVQDWEALQFLVSLRKGDLIHVAGSFTVVQKTNANGYTKFTIKIEAKKIKVDEHLLVLNPDQHNTGSNRLLLLKHCFIHLKNQDRVATSITAEILEKEMKTAVFDSFATSKTLNIELLQKEQDKITKDVQQVATKKRKLDETVGLFDFIKGSSDMQED